MRRGREYSPRLSGIDMSRVKSPRPLATASLAVHAKWMCVTSAMLVLAGYVALVVAGASLAEPVNPSNAAFAAAPGGRATVETTSEPDGRTKIVVRGKYQDARRFLRAFFAALAADDAANPAFDVDLDLNVAALAGFNGEVLRDAALRLSGKGAEIHEFSLAGKFGSAGIRGELRPRADGGRTIQIEAEDAGAFLRFVNVYRRAQKGRAVIAIDASALKAAARQGTIEVHDFSIVSEPDYRPFFPPKNKKGTANVLNLAHLKLAFKLSSDQVLVNDGIAIGPLIGATVEGKINFAHDQLDLRGVVIPLFASNGLSQQASPLEIQPLAEELFSIGYTITGPMEANVLRIDLAVPLAPGVLRRLFALGAAPHE
jgi:hypothetical protein